jgi:hypothetical protein
MTLKKTCISKVFQFYARLRHAKIRSLNHLLLPTLTPGGLKFAKTRKKGAAGLLNALAYKSEAAPGPRLLCIYWHNR